MPRNPEQAQQLANYFREGGRYERLLMPSRDLAWILGILASRGGLDKEGKISLFTNDENLFRTFESSGEKLFGVKPECEIFKTSHKEKEYRYIKAQFHIQNAFQVLGDLSHSEWPHTIAEHHGWLLENPQYIWGFVEGHLETKGHIMTYPKEWQIAFRAINTQAANYLKGLLEQVGIKDIKIKYDKREEEKVSHVSVTHLDDIKTIAENVHLKTQAKEQKLDFFRQHLPARPNSRERKENFVEYVIKENDQFRMGRISRLSSYEELSHQFDYTRDTVVQYLSEKGLTQERKRAEDEKRPEILKPSAALAWMLGVLAGGGQVKKKGQIHLDSVNEDLLEEFKSVGERLFKLNSTSIPIGIRKDGRQNKRVSFFSADIATLLGDFRGTEWVNTIRERYNWILENERYIWTFIEGFFEEKGNVYTTNWKRIVFYIYKHNAVSLFADMLSMVNIKTCRYRNKKFLIDTLSDIKTFAEKVHSKIPEKERRLEFCRQLFPKRARTVVSSEEEVILEWIRLHKELGHSPTKHQIDRLLQQRRTKFGSYIYVHRFGKREERKRSFALARENLERIIQEHEESRKIQSGEVGPAQQVQVFPTPGDEMK